MSLQWGSKRGGQRLNQGLKRQIVRCMSTMGLTVALSSGVNTAQAAGCFITPAGCYCVDMAPYTSSIEQSISEYMNQVLSMSYQEFLAKAQEMTSQGTITGAYNVASVLDKYQVPGSVLIFGPNAGSGPAMAPGNAQRPAISMPDDFVSAVSQHHNNRRLFHQSNSDINPLAIELTAEADTVQRTAQDIRGLQPYQAAVDAPAWINRFDPLFYVNPDPAVQISDWYSPGFGVSPTGMSGLITRLDNIPDDNELDAMSSTELELLLLRHQDHLLRKMALHAMAKPAMAEALLLSVKEYLAGANQSLSGMSGGGAEGLKIQVINRRITVVLKLQILLSELSKEQLLAVKLQHNRQGAVQ